MGLFIESFGRCLLRFAGSRSSATSRPVRQGESKRSGEQAKFVSDPQEFDVEFVVSEAFAAFRCDHRCRNHTLELEPSQPT